MANQPTDDPLDDDTSPLAKAVSALAMRNIGPAALGGRIADLAIHPDRPNTWFVAVGSGGVWRTDNAGITWKPIFDDQPSYSIGCVRIDPSRPEVVWVGTGEAVSGRHVAWGDGVYRSLDGGASWERMGLEGAEHISDILIDPRNSDVIYVAAEGPLWSAGGERGLFKSTDGGSNWASMLEIDEDTGITSAVFAPGDPDTIYAASYQRRRRVWSFVGGGPGSGIHVSNDGGGSWRKITAGLPKSDMGRIGLAVTAAAPELVYATIEAADAKEKGFYRSTNRGGSWERRNEYLSGGTGPHYYQELFASPTDPHKVYQVDVFLHVTTDGGKTFRNMENGEHKHSDNHVVWIDPHDGQHLIVGCDAGLYESYDDGEAWRHVPNLPISQLYRVAVDNSVPFTNVLAGAQDLGTLAGPLRTAHVDGVRNQDWWVPLGADGYQVAFDPEDPDVSYLEWQIGNVMRHDKRTMELHDIKPMPEPDDPPERWNWDTPIVISAHDPKRLYVASQRLWRSDDRGDSWTPISDDLTTDPSRLELPVGDRIESVDALYDHMAMSFYGTISAVAESPLVDGLLYVGTDDGLVQVTEDGGATWREAERPPGLPEVAFINDIEASAHDPDAVLVAADDHKSGDYSPYVFESRDRGRSWHPIESDLPQDTIVWAIEQDHIEEQLLFAGSERAVHVSVDGGEHWHRLSKDTPTISFRDLAIQRRDADLVAASFGRGIWVLDDYSPLRALAADALDQPAALFPVRDAWWYEPHHLAQAKGQPTRGSTAYRSPNPDFGATFTYHLAEDLRSAKDARRETEKQLEAAADVPFPGWDALRNELLDSGPLLVLLVRDGEGEPVSTVRAEVTAGLHRTAWDLRRPSPSPVDLSEPGFRAPWELPPRGVLVRPGTYSVELVQLDADGPELLSGPEAFEVVATPAVVQTADEAEHDVFRQRVAGLARAVAGADKSLAAARERVKHLRAGIADTAAALELFERLEEANHRLEGLAAQLLGDPAREKWHEPDAPSIKGRVDRVLWMHGSTTGGPTPTQRASIDRAEAEFGPVQEALDALIDQELRAIAESLDAGGGSWTPR